MCVICDLNYTWCELFYLCSVLYLINAKWYVNCIIHVCDICHTNNPFVRPFVMMFRLTKGWNLSNVNIILGQSDDWIICVLLATRTWNVQCYFLSRICRSIRHHFNRSVTHEPYVSLLLMSRMLSLCCRLWWRCAAGQVLIPQLCKPRRLPSQSLHHPGSITGRGNYSLIYTYSKVHL